MGALVKLITDVPGLTKLLGVVGVTGATTLYLVYWLTSSVSADIKDVKKNVEDHLKQTSTYGEKMDKNLKIQWAALCLEPKTKRIEQFCDNIILDEKK